MRTILALLLLASCSPVLNSTYSVITTRAYVKQVDYDVVTCSFKPLVWGFKADSICFAVSDNPTCFSQAKVYDDDPIYGVVVIAKSYFNEDYSIRYKAEDSGFIIFVSNLETKQNHFIISSSNICDPF